MTTIPSLEILKQKQEELLLAEVGALVHNIGKLSEEFLKYQAGETDFGHYDYQAIVGIVAQLIPSTLTSQERQRLQSALDANQEAVTSALLSADHKNWLMNRVLDLPVPLNDHKYALGDFIEFQDFGWYKPTKGGSPPRVVLLFPSGSRGTELLEASHNAASGVEKEGAPKDDGKQTEFPLYLATAFGLETPIQENNLKTWRNELLDALRLNGRSTSKLTNLEKAIGDTRRPINEVRLSDLSFSVAALFKSAMAQAVVLQKWTQRDDLRWRLLRVNFDVLNLYSKAVKIADLLGYQRAVNDACQKVKTLVEKEYPLGNEIYRDTSGIYFTFPDLDLPADLAQEIRRRVEEVEPELAPRIAVTVGDGNTAREQLKGILGEARNEALQTLKQPFDAANFSLRWQQEWDNGDKKWELCPVCRLRPKREDAEACETCVGRRQSRVQAWLQNPAQTIWLDEIADHNDRVALLVGKFGLEDWLSGEMVETLLVKAVENDPDACKPKNPSPARLRRVWETCQRFWTETVEQEILANHGYGKGTDAADLRCLRLLVIPDKKNGWTENVPYDGTLNGKPVSLLWDEQAKYFVTISNLQLAAGDTEDVNEFVGKLRGQQIVVSAPDNPRQQIPIIMQGAMRAMGAMGTYSPYLPLLASPDQFLALVPAHDALAIVNKIHEDYQNQFGKVQNRLPLFLGLVFFQRKTPLVAVMDTARRMLDVPVSSEQWTVKQFVNDALSFENGVTWSVPTKMGDGTTDDVWYPYFFVEQFADGTPDNRNYRFQRDGRWLVRVNDLKQGDVVSITPSRFAYLYLEHTAQRFEFDSQRDVLLLDKLPRLRKMWDALTQSGITDTGLRGVQALLESKGAAWGVQSQEFAQLTETTLQEANLFERKDKDGNPLPDIVRPDDVISGRFFRCLNLYMTILKQRIGK